MSSGSIPSPMPPRSSDTFPSPCMVPRRSTSTTPSTWPEAKHRAASLLRRSTPSPRGPAICCQRAGCLRPMHSPAMRQWAAAPGPLGTWLAARSRRRQENYRPGWRRGVCSQLSHCDPARTEGRPDRRVPVPRIGEHSLLPTAATTALLRSTRPATRRGSTRRRRCRHHRAGSTFPTMPSLFMVGPGSSPTRRTTTPSWKSAIRPARSCGSTGIPARLAQARDTSTSPMMRTCSSPVSSRSPMRPTTGSCSSHPKARC